MSLSLPQPNRVVVSDTGGNATTSLVTATELGHTKGATSSIQDQLDDASFNTVRIFTDWESNSSTLAATPLSFVPKPMRTYAVDAHMYFVANAADYSHTLGIRWPTPLYNVNSGGATLAYPISNYVGGFANVAVMRSSSQTADPQVTMTNATVSNVPLEVSVQALFTTANVPQANMSPFSILANVSDPARYVKLLYGSHLTYRSFKQLPNFPPYITTPVLETYSLSTLGTPLVFDMEATDPEGSPLTWSYEAVGMGNIAAISQENNVFTITPSMGETYAGSFTLTLRVTDGTNTSSVSTTLTKTSTAPTIQTIINESYTLSTTGQATVFTLEATDPENTPLTWSFTTSGLANIATVTQDTNTFTITPSTSEANSGSFTITFSVTDGTNTTSKSTTLTKPTTPPTLANVLSSYTLSTLGTPTVVTLDASDVEGSALTYSYDVVSGSMGNIATIDQSNNVFTITPSLGETYAGSFTLRFGVADAYNPTVYTNNAVFTKPSTAPTIASSVDASYAFATDGTPIVITIEASDAEGSPLTYGYELVSGSLGSTASIVQDTNTFTITPSTNTAHEGSFQLRFSVTDGVNTVYTNGATFTLSFGGGVVFAYPGTYTWTAPVSSVSVVCVGGGGGGGSGLRALGGGGGGLGYKNAVTVTPGSSYEVVVGRGGVSNGEDSYFVNSSTVRGGGGGGGLASTNTAGLLSTATGGTYVGDGGSAGGAGGVVEGDTVLMIAGGSGSGGSNTLAYSYDGIGWTGLGKSIFSTSCNTAAWNGSLWVAVGSGTNTLATSPDGVTWTPRTSPFSSAGNGVAWNGSVWVAVGNGTNSIATSSDGVTWTPRTSPFSRGYGVAWNGSLWVAVGDGSTDTIATSTDGITWTGRGKSIVSSAGRSVAWNGSRWVAVGSSTNTIAYSVDGITWTGLGSTRFTSTGRGVASA